MHYDNRDMELSQILRMLTLAWKKNKDYAKKIRIVQGKFLDVRDKWLVI